MAMYLTIFHILFENAGHTFLNNHKSWKIICHNDYYIWLNFVLYYSISSTSYLILAKQRILRKFFVKKNKNLAA